MFAGRLKIALLILIVALPPRWCCSALLARDCCRSAGAQSGELSVGDAPAKPLPVANPVPNCPHCVRRAAEQISADSTITESSSAAPLAAAPLDRECQCCARPIGEPARRISLSFFAAADFVVATLISPLELVAAVRQRPPALSAQPPANLQQQLCRWLC